MRKPILFFACLFALISSYGQGLLFKEQSQGEIIALKKVVINSAIENQVATTELIHTYQTDSLSNQQKFAYPLPANATATRLAWQVEGGIWKYATFKREKQDTTLPGNGSQNPAQEYYKDYIGQNGIYLDIPDEIQTRKHIKIAIEYVEILPYSFGKVNLSLPLEYKNATDAVIDSIELNISLNSKRDIDTFNLNKSGFSITNNTLKQKSITHKFVNYYEAQVLKFSYQLDSKKIELIQMSSLIPDSLRACPDSIPGFATFLIEPEKNEEVNYTKKNFTLVIDKSGSMGTTKMDQAKEAAKYIVRNLNLGDYFNIIPFSSSATSFQPNHVEYNASTEVNAINYINNLRSGGGTNVTDALTKTIAQFSNADTSRANIIIFFTDGHANSSTDNVITNVTNEVSKSGADIFLYSFGIGSNTNKRLLTLLADQNNGIASFLESNDLQTGISEFYNKISDPVLVGADVSFSPNLVTEIYPKKIPNLYGSGQMIIHGRYKKGGTSTLTLKGKSFGKDVTYQYNVVLSDTLNTRYSFLPKVWAKKKIEHQYIEYNKTLSDIAKDSIKGSIEDLSLCNQIISPFTSFDSYNSTTGGNNYQSGIVLTALDEEELENKIQILVSPNPIINQFTIDCQNIVDDYQDIESVIIMDQSGRVIFSGNVTLENGKILLDANNIGLTTGIYFLKIKTNKAQHVIKIIKA